MATISDVRRTHAAALRLFREGSVDLAALLISRAGRQLLALLDERENAARRARLLGIFPDNRPVDLLEGIPALESRASFLQAADAVADGIHEIDTPTWETWVSGWSQKIFGYLTPVTAWWETRPGSVKAAIAGAAVLVGVGIIAINVRSIRSRRASHGMTAELYADPGFGGPAQRVIVKKLSFDSVAELHPTHPDRTEQFSIRFTGFLNIPHDGGYEFSMFEDDSATVWLDGVPILDSIVARNGKKRLELKRGLHPLRVDYIQWMGGGEFHLYWQPDGEDKTLIGPEYLFVGNPSRR